MTQNVFPTTNVWNQWSDEMTCFPVLQFVVNSMMSVVAKMPHGLNGTKNRAHEQENEIDYIVVFKEIASVHVCFIQGITKITL